MILVGDQTKQAQLLGWDYESTKWDKEHKHIITARSAFIDTLPPLRANSSRRRRWFSARPCISLTAQGRQLRQSAILREPRREHVARGVLYRRVH